MSWLPKRCVVVPIDFSDESFQALDVATHLVEKPEHLQVVHVLQELSPVEPGELWDTVDNESRARHALKTLHEQLQRRGHPQVSTHILFGDPGHGIAEFARQQQAELIVLPSRGRTGISRLLIGSVAERVVRLSHCPVLVLRS
ncbi:MAG: universal stress protein [Pirellulaceae bacterium]|nr:universal stress protein [Pirellulaceae bacterium]